MGRAESFANEIRKILEGFQKSREWADLVRVLELLKKTLRSPKYAALREIPHTYEVSCVLARCLNPQLPSGVHQKTLQIYGFIFERLGPTDGRSDMLSRHLNLFTMGLFSLYVRAAMVVRPMISKLISDHLLPLGQRLAPCLPSMIACLLPGVEDESAETYDEVLDLLGAVSSAVGEEMYLNALFRAIATAGYARFPALKMLQLRLESATEVLDTVHPDLLCEALVKALRDRNPHTVSVILDFIFQFLPFQYPKLSDSHKVRLMVEVVLRLPLRMTSVSRRVWWLILGYDQFDHVDLDFFHNTTYPLLVEALGVVFSRSIQLEIDRAMHDERSTDDVARQASPVVIRERILRYPLTTMELLLAGPVGACGELQDALRAELLSVVIGHVIKYCSDHLLTRTVTIAKPARSLFNSLDAGQVWDCIKTELKRNPDRLTEVTNIAELLKSTLLDDYTPIFDVVLSLIPDLCNESLNLEQLFSFVNVVLPYRFISHTNPFAQSLNALLREQISESASHKILHAGLKAVPTYQQLPTFLDVAGVTQPFDPATPATIELESLIPFRIALMKSIQEHVGVDALNSQPLLRIAQIFRLLNHTLLATGASIIDALERSDADIAETLPQLHGTFLEMPLFQPLLEKLETCQRSSISDTLFTVLFENLLFWATNADSLLLSASHLKAIANPKTGVAIIEHLWQILQDVSRSSSSAAVLLIKYSGLQNTPTSKFFRKVLSHSKDAKSRYDTFNAYFQMWTIARTHKLDPALPATSSRTMLLALDVLQSSSPLFRRLGSTFILYNQRYLPLMLSPVFELLLGSKCAVSYPDYVLAHEYDVKRVCYSINTLKAIIEIDPLAIIAALVPVIGPNTMVGDEVSQLGRRYQALHITSGAQEWEEVEDDLLMAEMKAPVIPITNYLELIFNLCLHFLRAKPREGMSEHFISRLNEVRATVTSFLESLAVSIPRLDALSPSFLRLRFNVIETLGDAIETKSLNAQIELLHLFAALITKTFADGYPLDLPYAPEFEANSGHLEYKPPMTELATAIKHLRRGLREALQLLNQPLTMAYVHVVEAVLQHTAVGLREVTTPLLTTLVQEVCRLTLNQLSFSNTQFLSIMISLLVRIVGEILTRADNEQKAMKAAAEEEESKSIIESVFFVPLYFINFIGELASTQEETELPPATLARTALLSVLPPLLNACLQVWMWVTRENDDPHGWVISPDDPMLGSLKQLVVSLVGCLSTSPQYLVHALFEVWARLPTPEVHEYDWEPNLVRMHDDVEDHKFPVKLEPHHEAVLELIFTQDNLTSTEILTACSAILNDICTRASPEDAFSREVAIMAFLRAIFFRKGPAFAYDCAGPLCLLIQRALNTMRSSVALIELFEFVVDISPYLFNADCIRSGSGTESVSTTQSITSPRSPKAIQALRKQITEEFEKMCLYLRSVIMESRWYTHGQHLHAKSAPIAGRKTIFDSVVSPAQFHAYFPPVVYSRPVDQATYLTACSRKALHVLARRLPFLLLKTGVVNTSRHVVAISPLVAAALQLATSSVRSAAATLFLAAMTQGPSSWSKLFKQKCFDHFKTDTFFSRSRATLANWKLLVYRFSSIADEDPTGYSRKPALPQIIDSIFPSGLIERISSTAGNTNDVGFLMRLAFILFCAPFDFFASQMRLVIERINQCIKSSSPSVKAATFVLMRVVIMRFSPTHLSHHWPLVFTESLRVLQNHDLYDDRILIAVLKLLDTALVLGYDAVAHHQWMFLMDPLLPIFESLRESDPEYYAQALPGISRIAHSLQTPEKLTLDVDPVIYRAPILGIDLLEPRSRLKTFVSHVASYVSVSCMFSIAPDLETLDEIALIDFTTNLYAGDPSVKHIDYDRARSSDDTGDEVETGITYLDWALSISSSPTAPRPLMNPKEDILAKCDDDEQVSSYASTPKTPEDLQISPSIEIESLDLRSGVPSPSPSPTPDLDISEVTIHIEDVSADSHIPNDQPEDDDK